jgi:hypothetical protein
MAQGSAQPLTEMSTRNFPGGKVRPALKTDNLTAIYESFVYDSWDKWTDVRELPRITALYICFVSCTCCISLCMQRSCGGLIHSQRNFKNYQRIQSVAINSQWNQFKDTVYHELDALIVPFQAQLRNCVLITFVRLFGEEINVLQGLYLHNTTQKKCENKSINRVRFEPWYSDVGRLVTKCGHSHLHVNIKSIM